MREVNFSIPSANKASVGVTSALYDRRALDCTSTLPIVNSLNHLAYLTTSSARIRDILTVDGGVERLVCILKEGRSKEMMEMWKWNLAFQCVVNIGVRGSETVRTRVVEADMVPVIATILDNYIKVVEKCREKVEAEYRRSNARMLSNPRSITRYQDQHQHAVGMPQLRTDRPRRPAPPPIEIPQAPVAPPPATESLQQPQTSLPTISLSSPPERTSFARPQQSHLHHRRQELRSPTLELRRTLPNFSVLPMAPLDNASALATLRPVRDADRLPSMLPSLHTETSSQPQSPTTPSGPSQSRTIGHVPSRRRRRPSIRHQNSNSGVSDDEQPDEIADVPSDSVPGGATEEPVVGIQNDVAMPDVPDSDTIFDEADMAPVQLGAAGTDATANALITIGAGSTVNLIMPQPEPALGATPAANLNTLNVMNVMPPAMNVPALQVVPRQLANLVTDRHAAAGIVAAVPRDEDVLMSLQLLAYVSKYCNLRKYFQNSHLVPRLKIGKRLMLLDGELPPDEPAAFEDDPDNEYLLPEDLNIFPLVEQFTVRHHSPDMQYWAGVVMRNLCRKDDSRGGIRQCAYYMCGKWEEYTRQFAKCRRCRRTKYCSKECQKSAWGFHRHWCVPAQPEDTARTVPVRA